MESLVAGPSTVFVVTGRHPSSWVHSSVGDSSIFSSVGPGVVAVVMAVIGARITSLTAAREMALGNLLILRTTPLTRGSFCSES